MNAPFRVSVDLSGLLTEQDGIFSAMFPLVGQAVRAVAEEGAFRWKQAVMQARLWEGEKTPYVESISWQMIGPYEAEITTSYRLAGEIETGRPPKDLKKMLQTSRKTRAGKNGKYLIIPFRHNTPGNTAHAPAMPDDVYAAAKRLAPSHLLPPGSVKAATRTSASGHVVPQHSYHWGGRLPAGMVPKLKPSHKSDPYAGMVRFNTSTGKGKSSAYLTFRVMSEKSNGWVVGPRPGLNLARKTRDGLQPLLDAAIGKAVEMAVKSG